MHVYQPTWHGAAFWYRHLFFLCAIGLANLYSSNVSGNGGCLCITYYFFCVRIAYLITFYYSCIENSLVFECVSPPLMDCKPDTRVTKVIWLWQNIYNWVEHVYRASLNNIVTYLLSLLSPVCAIGALMTSIVRSCLIQTHTFVLKRNP